MASNSEDDLPDYEKSSDAHDYNTESFVALFKDKTVIEGILHGLGQRYVNRTTKRLEPPGQIVENLDYFFEKLKDAMSDERKNDKKDPKPVGGEKSRRFWQPLRKLTAHQLVLEEPLKQLFLKTSTEHFFQDKKLLLRSQERNKADAMITLMQYGTQLAERRDQDRARCAVIGLWLNTVIRRIQKRTGSTTDNAPVITERKELLLYNSLFKDPESNNMDNVPDFSKFHTWLKAQNKLADRYVSLAKNLSEGALVYLIPHFNPSHLTDGLAKHTDYGKEGMEHLRSIVEELPVTELNARIEILKDHLNTNVFANLVAHMDSEQYQAGDKGDGNKQQNDEQDEEDDDNDGEEDDDSDEERNEREV